MICTTVPGRWAPKYVGRDAGFVQWRVPGFLPELKSPRLLSEVQCVEKPLADREWTDYYRCTVNVGERTHGVIGVYVERMADFTICDLFAPAQPRE